LDNHLLIIFGASGDLTRRKLIPALFELYREHLLPANYAILGISRSALSSELFRDNMKTALAESTEGNHENEIIEFVKLLYYISIETSDSEAYKQVKEYIAGLDAACQTDGNCLFYLATPPDLSEIIARNLSLQ
jgi:glucose-6-phosphate 1-dehydrogenase